MRTLPADLRLVAWEVTRSCNLACSHCRASALAGPYEGELDTDAAVRLLDEIASFARPVIILTGGEPLLRGDILTLVRHGRRRGLRMVLATNGTLVTDDVARELVGAGVARVSVSLDGPDEASHDAFRMVEGAFAGALRGIGALRGAGMPFQINTTVTRENLKSLPEIHDLACRLGAVAHHIFLLVPTGRGRLLTEGAVGPREYEDTLVWFHRLSLTSPIEVKATCAPHYQRIRRQHRGAGDGRRGRGEAGHGALSASTRGCLGGIAFCFVSHTGRLQPCGYLEVDCGNVRERGFAELWRESEVFVRLRNLDLYGGKCGRCPFLKVCGGCRARAYEATGDYLAEEPLCAYEVKGGREETA
ncbi:MAG TPA: heme b synthase [Syntrophales bacterium]|nr:heme b synthase [Syntrophales bacterium]HOM06843.1 heme b synthase [Syntrophales bacterium]HON99361.1 heme b synthase [Syntrophales bacterium]HPC00603.1 heme b synthase [Syntrophales bacterium]HPQ06384.1 heme b synthase [Syntrophales bacterium]